MLAAVHEEDGNTIGSKKGINTGVMVVTSCDAVTVSMTVSGSDVVPTAAEDELGGADEGYIKSNTDRMRKV